MAIEQNRQELLICPRKLALSAAIEGSEVGGLRPLGPTLEVICDPECSGPIEVPRSAMSPLRILSAMKTVCKQES